MKEYALYKGEDLLCIDTIQGIADYLKIKYESVKFYNTTSYKKRIKNKDKQRYLVCLD